MKRKMKCWAVLYIVLFASGACMTKQQPITVEKDSVAPGTQVKKGDEKFDLLGNPIRIGEKLPSVALVDAQTMTERDLSKERGKILFLSIVPSIDTKVCEAQTHYLGEEGDDALPPDIERITISRDTPFAQNRFAAEAKLTDITYLSDYKAGEFGSAMGLLVDKIRLLARSVILVDKEGVVRYIQVVPALPHLPDMEAAFAKARELSAQ